MTNIKTLKELQRTVKQTQQYVTENLQTKIAIIKSWKSKINALQILDDKLQELIIKLDQLENQTEALRQLVANMEEISNTRIFSKGALPADKENGAIAFIQD